MLIFSLSSSSSSSFSSSPSFFFFSFFNFSSFLLSNLFKIGFFFKSSPLFFLFRDSSEALRSNDNTHDIDDDEEEDDDDDAEDDDDDGDGGSLNTSVNFCFNPSRNSSPNSSRFEPPPSRTLLTHCQSKADVLSYDVFLLVSLKTLCSKSSSHPLLPLFSPPLTFLFVLFLSLGLERLVLWWILLWEFWWLR